MKPSPNQYGSLPYFFAFARRSSSFGNVFIRTWSHSLKYTPRQGRYVKGVGDSGINMESYQSGCEEFCWLGFVVAELVDANSGDKHMPKRFVHSLFDAVAFVCHVLTPFGRGSKN